MHRPSRPDNDQLINAFMMGTPSVETAPCQCEKWKVYNIRRIPIFPASLILILSQAPLPWSTDEVEKIVTAFIPSQEVRQHAF